MEIDLIKLGLNVDDFIEGKRQIKDATREINKALVTGLKVSELSIFGSDGQKNIQKTIELITATGKEYRILVNETKKGKVLVGNITTNSTLSLDPKKRFDDIRKFERAAAADRKKETEENIRAAGVLLNALNRKKEAAERAAKAEEAANRRAGDSLNKQRQRAIAALDAEKARERAASIANRVAVNVGRDQGIGAISQNQLLKLENAKKQLASIIQQTGIAPRQFKNVFDEIKSGALDLSSVTDRRTRAVAISLLRLKKAYKEVADEQIKLTNATAQYNAQGQQIGVSPQEQKLAAAKLAAQKQRELTRQAIIDAKKTEREFFNIQASALNKGIESRLGGIKLGFNSQDIAAIRSAQSGLANLVVTAGAGSARFQQLFSAIQNGTVASLGPLTIEERKAEVAMRRLIGAFDDANNTGRKIEKVLISWRGLARIFVVQQLHQVIGRVTNSLIQGSQASSEYYKRIAEIQTISQKANKSTSDWNASLVQLSNAYGTDILKTTEAAYEALSNQISKSSNVTNFMAEAAIFARTTSSSLEQSVNLLSSTLNAYNLNQIATNRISSILFKTIDLGRVRAQDLANTFGNSATLASTLGVSIEELAASISTLTRQGIQPDTALTLVNNIILKLLKPTEGMKDLFDKLGVSSGQAAIKTYGFAGVLKKLNEQFESGGLKAFGDLESDMRAIRGAAGLAGNTFKEFEKDLNEIKNTTAEYRGAAEITAESLSQKLAIELNKVNNLLVTDAGKQFLQTNLQLIQSIGSLDKALKPVLDGFLNLYKSATVVGGSLINLINATANLGGGFSKLIPVLATAYTFYKLSPLAVLIYEGAMKTLVATNTAFAYSAFLSQGQVNALGLSMLFTSGAATSLATSASAVAVALATNPVTWIVAAGAGLAYLVSSYYDAQRQISAIATETAAKLAEQDQKRSAELAKRLDQETELFKSNLDERFQLFFRYTAAIRAKLNETKTEFDAIDYKFASLDFENSIFGKSVLDSADQVLDRLSELQELGTQLAFSGDLENAKKVFEDLNTQVAEYNREVLKGLRDNNNEIARLNDLKEENKFENSLIGLGTGAKSAKFRSEITKLKTEAQDLLNKGDIEESLEKLDRAYKLTEKLINLTDSGKGARRNKTAEAEQELIINKQLEARNKLEEQIKNKKLPAQDIEKNTLGLLDRQVQAVKTLEEGYNKVTNAIRLMGEELQKATASKKESQDNIDKAANNIIAKATQLRKVEPSGTVGDDFRLFLEEAENLKKLTQAPILDSKAFMESQRKFGIYSTRVEKTLGSGTKIGENQEQVGKIFDEIQRSMVEIVQESAQKRLAAEKEQEIKQLKFQDEEKLKLLKEQSNRLGVVLEGIPVDKFKSVVIEVNEGMSSVVEALKTLEIGLTGKVGGRATGGPLGFALGGRLGRDNRLFMGHDGEFVVNAEAAAKFRPQLVAMNSSMQNMSTGGPITNVGDIHINANVGESSQATVVDIGRQLHRALRLRTIRLGNA